MFRLIVPHHLTILPHPRGPQLCPLMGCSVALNTPPASRRQSVCRESSRWTGNLKIHPLQVFLHPSVRCRTVHTTRPGYNSLCHLPGKLCISYRLPQDLYGGGLPEDCCLERRKIADCNRLRVCEETSISQDAKVNSLWYLPIGREYALPSYQPHCKTCRQQIRTFGYADAYK